MASSTDVGLCDGTEVQVKLLDLKETRDSLRDAVRNARVQVEIDGQKVWLMSANYNLPIAVGKVQIDCPITKGTTNNANGDHWGLEKDARLRLWPAVVVQRDSATLLGGFHLADPTYMSYQTR